MALTLKEIKETLGKEVQEKYNLTLKEEDERELCFIYRPRQAVIVISFREIDGDIYLCMASSGVVTTILVEKVVTAPNVIKMQGGTSDVTIFTKEEWETE